MKFDVMIDVDDVIYAYDSATLARADEHGCLDEDVETGSPVVCRGCA